MVMPTTLTTKGQVTIPKRIRDEMQLSPGSAVEFSVNETGQVVLQRAGPVRRSRSPAHDRFDAVRGRADVPWQTDELMKLLRADD
jgi:AbrB family looped-hinge helix DNA binding protein